MTLRSLFPPKTVMSLSASHPNFTVSRKGHHSQSAVKQSQSKRTFRHSTVRPSKNSFTQVTRIPQNTRTMNSVCLDLLCSVCLSVCLSVGFVVDGDLFVLFCFNCYFVVLSFLAIYLALSLTLPTTDAST